MSREQHLPKLQEFKPSYSMADLASEADVVTLVDVIRLLCTVGKFLQRKAEVLGVGHENYSFEFPTMEEINTEISSEQEAREFLNFAIGVYNAQYQYLNELQEKINRR
jgi:hypothetical protein